MLSALLSASARVFAIALLIICIMNLLNTFLHLIAYALCTTFQGIAGFIRGKIPQRLVYRLLNQLIQYLRR
jgi:hypothetical protein